MLPTQTERNEKFLICKHKTKNVSSPPAYFVDIFIERKIKVKSMLFPELYFIEKFPIHMISTKIVFELLL